LKEVNPVYDIEVYADRFEQEEMYALEHPAELEHEEALERAAQLAQLLERMDRVLEAMGVVIPSSIPVQTEEETAMFEEWLS